MAARKTARFYVYAIGDGDPAYIGKGSGRRLKNQQRHFGMPGHEIARFFKEADAYKFERAMIAEHRPRLNKHPGGNGSRATPIRPGRPTLGEQLMDEIGTRAYAARILLALPRHMIDVSKVDEFRAVAYGWSNAW